MFKWIKLLLRVTDKKIVELMITELKMYFLGAKEMEQQKLTRVVFVTKFFSSEATFAATYIPERQ